MKTATEPAAARPRVPRAARVDYRALAEFRYQMRRFLRASEEAARASGLEPQHHQLLLALKGAPPGEVPTIAWLAERLQLQHHSVVGLVDRLVERKLIRRRRDPADQRRALVTLTGDGEEILHELSVFHQDELRTLAPAFIASIAAIVRATPRR
jgi:DNA-binding MarR family transcriptional regulator